MTRGRRILLAVTVVVLAVVGLTAFLVATEAGTRLTLKLASPLLPEGLEPGRVSGTLAGPLHVEDLRFVTDTMTVTVGGATLDWRPMRLAAGELAVDAVDAEDIEVVLTASDEPVDADPWRPSDIELPVAISVDRATARRVRVQPADGDAIVIDEASLAGRYDDGGLRLDPVSISGPSLSVDGHASLDPTDTWPAGFDLRVSYRDDRRAPLDVAIQGDGDVEQLTLAITAGAPWSTSVGGTLTDLLETPTVDLEVKVDSARLAELDPSWADMTLDGGVRVDGAVDAARLSGALSLGVPGLPPVRIEADAIGNARRIEIGNLAVRAADSVIAASGAVTLEDTGPTASLSGEWSALRWPFDGETVAVRSRQGRFDMSGDDERIDIELDGTIGGGHLGLGGFVDLAATPIRFDLSGDWSELATTTEPPLRSPTGTLSISGTTDAFEAALDSELDAAPWATGTGTVRATGNREGLTLTTLSLPVAGGRVEGTGLVAWVDGLDAQADVAVRAVDPAVFAPRVRGAINGDAAITAKLEDGSRRLTLSIPRIDGTVFEADLDGRADLALADDRLTIDAFELAVAGNAVRVEGTTGTSTDLNWTIDAPDLSRLGGELAGTVASTGHLVGDDSRWSIDGNLEASGVEAGTLRVASVAARAVAGDRPGDALTLRVDAKDLGIGRRDIAALLLQANGTTARHNGQIALRSSYGGLTARVAGGYEQSTWSGVLDALRAEPAQRDGPWTLDRPASLTVSPNALSLDESCLVQADASLCARVAWNRSGLGDIDARVSALDIRDFSPWLPPALAYDGTLSGTVRLAGRADGMTGDADLTLSPGQVLQREQLEPDDPALLAWREAGISAALTRSSLTVDAGFELVDAGRLTLDLAVPMDGLAPDPDGLLVGKLAASLTEFPLIETLVPDVDELAGRVAVDLALGGTPRAPTLTGSARLTEASAELPRLGLTVTDTRLAVTASGSRVTIDGGARSGDGEVNFDADFRLVDGGWQGQGSLSGDRFTAVSLPELTATLSPELTVTVDNRSLLLEGDVAVPAARIEPRDLRGTVQASPDAVIVDASAPAGAREPWQVTSRVRITLGEDVDIDAFGLEGRIAGSLVAVDTPGKPSTGTGELNVLDATLTAYSQELTVERGRLIFTGGPLSSPGVDIRATRSIGDVVVGVDLRGQLAQPEATLYSNPAMNQTEALSYLVLGRPLDTVGSGDQSVLGQASVRLGLSGAEFLAQEVGRRIGLDAVEIRGTDDEASTELVVGKYLSPRLYVSYGLGLFDAFNTVLVRYNITDDLAIQTEAGTEISADIFYTLER